MKTQLLKAAIACAAISGCGQNAPRSAEYFKSHIDEAQRVAQACGDSVVPADECDNAEGAVRHAKARARTKRFLGDGKAYREADDSKR